QATLPMNPHPLFGAGYESFWLGDRLKALWSQFWWQPNQAHNGYLETYLNSGIIGLVILACFLVVSYRRIWRPPIGDLASLGVAMWTVLLTYNMTEAAFKGHPLWVVFLLGTVVVQWPRAEGRHSTPGDRPKFQKSKKAVTG